MDELTVIFTKCYCNPLSWLIRWVLPRSRFALALSSHCYILNNDMCYQAIALKGVCTVSYKDAIKYDTIVKTISYKVLNLQAAIDFLNSQLGKPYDYKAALGLAIGGSRVWHEDDKWYCYELACGALRAGGRDEFENLTHITEIGLMSLKP